MEGYYVSIFHYISILSYWLVWSTSIKMLSICFLFQLAKNRTRRCFNHSIHFLPEPRKMCNYKCSEKSILCVCNLENEARKNSRSQSYVGRSSDPLRSRAFTAGLLSLLKVFWTFRLSNSALSKWNTKPYCKSKSVAGFSTILDYRRQ